MKILLFILRLISFPIAELGFILFNLASFISYRDCSYRMQDKEDGSFFEKWMYGGE